MVTATPQINYDLLQRLAERPHPLLHIAADFQAQVYGNPISWTAEVYTQARTAHHLLDLLGIPQEQQGHCYASDLDSRTYLALQEITTLRERLSRLGGWHRRATGPSGTFDDVCIECDRPWPCDTRRLAEGTYDEGRSASAPTPSGVPPSTPGSCDG